MRKDKRKRKYDSPYTEITRFDSDVITISEEYGGNEDEDEYEE